MRTRLRLCTVLLLLLTAGCGQLPGVSPAYPGPPPTPPQVAPYPPNPTWRPDEDPLRGCTVRPDDGLVICPSKATPFPTPPPIPTPPDTPVVTPIPLAQPPIIPELAGKETVPYRIVVRESAGTRLWKGQETPTSSVLRIVGSDGSDRGVALDTEKAAGLFLGHWLLQNEWGTPSPDGKRLALVLTDAWEYSASADAEKKGPPFHIYLFDLESREFRFLAEGEGPAWSPDGREIAYYRNGLWVIDLENGQERPLFRTEERQQLFPPLWSPDGKRILFRNYLESVNSDGYGPGEMVLVNADGSGEPSILPLPSSCPGILWLPEEDGFLVQCSSHLPIGADTSFFQVLKGGEVTAKFLSNYDLCACGGWPRYSPNGEWLLFSGTSVYEVLEGQHYFYDVWLLKSDGSTLRRLTLDTASDLVPQWSPDGTEVVYQKRGQGIWALNLATGRARQLWPGDVEFLVVQ